MKVRQLREALEEFASIYASEGQSERADALRALSQTLKPADAKRVDDLVPLLQRAGTVAEDPDALSIRQ